MVANHSRPAHAVIKLFLIAVVVALLAPVVNASQERALDRQYRKASKMPMDAQSLETLRWLGGGLLNGYVFTETPNGKRYFVSVDKDPAKAANYFKAAESRGDRVSKVILGIMYRQGNGVLKDLEKSLNLLRESKNGFYDAETEYGLVIHELLRTREISSGNDDALASEMVVALQVGERADYLPAINALAQIYNEGVYVERDEKAASLLTLRAEKIAREKVAVNEAIASALLRMEQYRKAANASQWAFDALVFLATIGIVGATSLSNFGSTCSVGCSPPSVVDLMNWGVL